MKKKKFLSKSEKRGKFPKKLKKKRNRGKIVENLVRDMCDFGKLTIIVGFSSIFLYILSRS